MGPPFATWRPCWTVDWGETKLGNITTILLQQIPATHSLCNHRVITGHEKLTVVHSHILPAASTWMCPFRRCSVSFHAFPIHFCGKVAACDGGGSSDGNNTDETNNRAYQQIYTQQHSLNYDIAQHKLRVSCLLVSSNIILC